MFVNFCQDGQSVHSQFTNHFALTDTYLPVLSACVICTVLSACVICLLTFPLGAIIIICLALAGNIVLG